MEKVTVLLPVLFPFAVYMAFGIIARVRYGKEADRDVLSFLFSISIVYLTAGIVCLSDIMAGQKQMYAYVLLKVYCVSSFLPAMFVRQIPGSSSVYHLRIYSAVMLTAVLICIDVLAITGFSLLSFNIISVFAVISALGYFVVIMIVSSRIQELKKAGFHITVAAAISNFILLLYNYTAGGILSYSMAVLLYMSVHVFLSLVMLKKSKPGKYAWLTMEQERNDVIEDPGVKFNNGTDIYNFSDVNVPLKERLIGLFETEKLFLSKDLTMEDVAMRLFTNKTYLSKTINVEMNKNFRELVNSFRVREAMKIFSQNSDISINELRDRCGFNNNASFTSAFKLNTGYTPGEWCRNAKTLAGGKKNVEKS